MDKFCIDKKLDTLGEFFGLSNFNESEKKQLRDALRANTKRKTSFMFIKKCART